MDDFETRRFYETPPGNELVIVFIIIFNNFDFNHFDIHHFVMMSK
jgi:hypothetical protein